MGGRALTVERVAEVSVLPLRSQDPYRHPLISSSVQASGGGDRVDVLGTQQQWRRQQEEKNDMVEKRHEWRGNGGGHSVRIDHRTHEGSDLSVVEWGEHDRECPV